MTVVHAAASCPVVRQTIGKSVLYPNSSVHNLPLLIYKRAFKATKLEEIASVMEQTFSANGYPAPWRFGKFDQTHFHSITHEILGVSAGSAHFRFGGPEGAIEEDLAAGDVMLLPAGLAHSCLEASRGFQMVGAYPGGEKNSSRDEYDMCHGSTEAEVAEAVANIENVPMLDKDPVFGDYGPVFDYWKA